jgi:hypothetical protein
MRHPSFSTSDLRYARLRAVSSGLEFHNQAVGRTVVVLIVCVFCVATALLGSGCESATDFSGVFIEDVPSSGVDEARDTAFRLTIYEYADSVGGFVEYYELDGLNTREDPYASPGACAYFGPVRRNEQSVRFEATAPDGGDVVRFELDAVRRGPISGTLLRDGGTVDDALATDDTFELSFVEDGRQTPASQCPDGLPVLDEVR